MDVRQATGGILIRGSNTSDIVMARLKFFEKAGNLGIDQFLEVTLEPDGQGMRFRLREELRQAWAPDCDTLQLCERRHLDTQASTDDLEQEILLAMLLAPVSFEFPSYGEFAASVRIRQNIVEAARRTELSFHTTKIERPAEYWRYSEERGFILVPGKSLIEALRTATQPEVSGTLYSFSCYRATEYVILLGIAEELDESNPSLLQALQYQWESRSIMSGRFHDIFLYEYGSMSEPLPPKYYVPGDRLWFRNPDERSSDVTGYEGSWVLYIGDGLFSNFWKRDKPYTLAAKCVELYHWRHAVYADTEGNLQMDETIVEERVRATMNDPVEVKLILEQMMRMRDPKGIYADGGCIDTTREYPRLILPGSSDLVLPLV